MSDPLSQLALSMGPLSLDDAYSDDDSISISSEKQGNVIDGKYVGPKSDMKAFVKQLVTLTRENRSWVQSDEETMDCAIQLCIHTLLPFVEDRGSCGFTHCYVSLCNLLQEAPWKDDAEIHILGGNYMECVQNELGEQFALELRNRVRETMEQHGIETSLEDSNDGPWERIIKIDWSKLVKQ